MCVCLCAQLLSRVQLFETPWTVAHQAPLSMGFPRQEYWSGLPCPPPGDLPNPGIYSAFPAMVDGFLTTEPPEKPHLIGLRTKIEIMVTLLPVIECPHVPI